MAFWIRGCGMSEGRIEDREFKEEERRKKKELGCHCEHSAAVLVGVGENLFQIGLGGCSSFANNNPKNPKANYNSTALDQLKGSWPACTEGFLRNKIKYKNFSNYPKRFYIPLILTFPSSVTP